MMESFNDELICNIIDDPYDDTSIMEEHHHHHDGHHHTNKNSFPIEFVEMGSVEDVRVSNDPKIDCYESMTVDEIVYSHLNGMSDSSFPESSFPDTLSSHQHRSSMDHHIHDESMEPIEVYHDTLTRSNKNNNKRYRRHGEIMSRSEGDLIEFDDCPLPFLEEEGIAVECQPPPHHAPQQYHQRISSSPPRLEQEQRTSSSNGQRPPMEKSNSWSGGCCAYSVSPSTTTYTTASTSSSHSTTTSTSNSGTTSGSGHGSSTNNVPIIRKSCRPGTQQRSASISSFAGEALSRVSQPNLDRYMRLLSAKQKKDQILMMTRVVLGLLQKSDQALYNQAMAAIEECSMRHKAKERGYESLTVSTQRHLRHIVGEDHWDRAKMLLRVKVERENQAHPNHTYMAYFKRLTMTEMKNFLAAYGMSRTDIDHMSRQDRVATLCHLSSTPSSPPSPRSSGGVECQY